MVATTQYAQVQVRQARLVFLVEYRPQVQVGLHAAE